MSNPDIEPACVLVSTRLALHGGETSESRQTSASQTSPAAASAVLFEPGSSEAVGVGTAVGSVTAIATEDRDGEQDDEELSDSTVTHRDVSEVERPRRYPYAAMFFIMAAVVGQRYTRTTTTTIYNTR